jgi:hypothetical protein
VGHEFCAGLAYLIFVVNISSVKILIN